MSKKDPAFLFYPSDFLTGTVFMSDEDVGIYVRLLCVQHQHGGMIDGASFLAKTDGHPAVAAKFVESEDGFYNTRLMDEMVKRAKKSANLSANARIRWEKEKEKQNQSNAIASDLHMPTENRDEDRDVNASASHKGDCQGGGMPGPDAINITEHFRLKWTSEHRDARKTPADIRKWQRSAQDMLDSDQRKRKEVIDKIDAVFGDSFWRKRVSGVDHLRTLWNDGKLDTIAGDLDAEQIAAMKALWGDPNDEQE